MLICSEYVQWLLWISPFIYKPTQEIYGKQVPKYDFNKQQMLKNLKPICFYGFLDWL